MQRTKKIPVKSILDSHMFSLFLIGVTDPGLQITVKIHQNNDGSLIDSFVYVRKQER